MDALADEPPGVSKLPAISLRKVTYHCSAFFLLDLRVKLIIIIDNWLRAFNLKDVNRYKMKYLIFLIMSKQLPISQQVRSEVLPPAV